MIQRIQTLWLLIGLLAWGTLFFGPVLSLTNETAAWTLKASGIFPDGAEEPVIRTVPLFILIAIVQFLLLAAVLMFKRRTLQMRITLYTMILQIFSYGMIALYMVQGMRQLEAKPGLLFLSIIPVVGFICSFFAFKGIRRDILVLKMVNRLR